MHVWQAEKDVRGRNEAGECIEGQLIDAEQATDPSSTSRAKLFNKLKAVEVEIDAVAASIEQARTVVRNENSVSDGIDNEEEGDEEGGRDTVRDSDNGLSLQHALASDRLRSLKKTKAHLQNELNEFCKDFPIEGIANGKLLDKLVREEPKPKPKRKRTLKEVKSTGKDSKKPRKAVAFDEDTNFDAVLDAASAGFVETVKCCKHNYVFSNLINW